MSRVIYTVDKHYGGMSQDEYVWPVGCFYDAEWVEVRRNSKEVTLNKSTTNGTTYPVLKTGSNHGEITAWNKTYQSSSRYTALAGTSLGYMYDFSGRSSNIYTSDNYAILSIGIYDNSPTWWTIFNPVYGFYINERGGLFRWTYDITWADAWILNYTYPWTLPAGFVFVNSSYPTDKRGTAAPYEIYWWNLVYACADKIFVVDITTASWAVMSTITIDKGFTIKWMTRIDSQFVIYASNDSAVDTTYTTKTWTAKGRVYYYDFGSLLAWYTYQRALTWNDRPILGVINRNNEDFVVAGSQFRRFFFQNNGAYNPQILFQSKITNTTSDRFYFDPKYGSSCINIGQLIAIPASEKLYTWGNIIPELGNAIFKEFTFTWYTPVSLYLDETGSDFILYVWLRKNSETSPWYNAYYATIYLNSHDPNYTTAWYVTENPFVWYGQRELKQSCKYEIGYFLEANSTIQIYASVDDWAFSLIDTITDTTKRKFVWLYKWDFYKIQFKMVLNTSTGNSTPHYYSLRVAYDTTRDEMT